MYSVRFQDRDPRMSKYVCVCVCVCFWKAHRNREASFVDMFCFWGEKRAPIRTSGIRFQAKSSNQTLTEKSTQSVVAAALLRLATSASTSTAAAALLLLAGITAVRSVRRLSVTGIRGRRRLSCIVLRVLIVPGHALRLSGHRRIAAGRRGSRRRRCCCRRGGRCCCRRLGPSAARVRRARLHEAKVDADAGKERAKKTIVLPTRLAVHMQCVRMSVLEGTGSVCALALDHPHPCRFIRNVHQRRQFTLWLLLALICFSITSASSILPMLR